MWMCTPFALSLSKGFDKLSPNVCGLGPNVCGFSPNGFWSRRKTEGQFSSMRGKNKLRMSSQWSILAPVPGGIATPFALSLSKGIWAC